MFGFVQKHRTFFFLAAYVGMFVLLAALGCYAVGGGKIGVPGHMKKEAEADTAVQLAYYDLPRMTVSVHNGSSLAPRVRVDVALEVARQDLRTIDGYQPRIIDRLTAFLGTLSADQIERPGSMSWLRTQMLSQVNKAGSPVMVRDLMFRQLVVL